MITPIADNPAVTDPQAALTRAQRQALVAVDFYKNQRPAGSVWIVGTERFSIHTIRALKRAGLLAGNSRGVWPTTAGKLAIDKLKENT
jgi:hypothetical protein